MLPETYLNIAPLLTRRQNIFWASSERRIKGYFDHYSHELPLHKLKVIVPVIGETVTVKNRDRDIRERRKVHWHELIHHVRQGSVQKIKVRCASVCMPS